MTQFLKRFWALGLVVVAIIVVVVVLRRPSTPTHPAPPTVVLAPVRQGTFLVQVEARGRVGPPPGSSAALAFPEAGRIASIDVHVGDQVTAGQALAQLDSAPYVLAAAQAQGDATAAAGTLQSTSATTAVRNAEALALARQAELKVQADRQSLERTRSLYAAGIAAAKDLQAAQSQLAADEADAQAARIRVQALRAGRSSAQTASSADVLAARGQDMRAQALLAQAQRDLANATLRAPNSGIVVAILKHPGESVDASTPVVTLGALLEHAATLSVPADEARSIHVGDRAKLRLTRSSQSYDGRVIATVPAVDPTTQQATVVVSGVPPNAVAGDAVEASITVAAQSGILVPTSSIVQDPQTSDTLVFVVSADKDGHQSFEPRKVEVGAGDLITTRIVRGVRPGEQIAAQGAFELLAPAPGSGD